VKSPNATSAIVFWEIGRERHGQAGIPDGCQITVGMGMGAC